MGYNNILINININEKTFDFEAVVEILLKT